MLHGALSFSDGWTLVEDQLRGSSTPASTLFTTGNGYVGIRGRPREPLGREGGGVLMAGLFEGRPYAHPERYFGLPERYQTIVPVTDPTCVEITVDGVPLRIDTGTWLEHRRRLDLRTGYVSTAGTWRSPAGARTALRSRRLVSLSQPGLAWLSIEVEPLDGPVLVTITAHLRANTSTRTFRDEPDALGRAWGRVFAPSGLVDTEAHVGLVHTTRCSGLAVACAMAPTAPAEVMARDVSDDHASLRYEGSAEPGRPLASDHRIAFADGLAGEAPAVLHAATRLLSDGAGTTFDDALAAQREVLDRFWDAATVVVEGAPRLERAVRFSTFQLFGSCALNPGRASPVKGLTGQGYQGHQLWELEVYVGHVLSLIAPDAARSMLDFRVATLPAARRNAAQMSLAGALYPWRTIDGREASAFLPAGAAQHHVNAAVAWAIEHHVACTGDEALLAEAGVEVLVETARLWMSVGHVGRDNRFRIDSVTGPDEYTTLVDNNLYTNVMAAANLEAAACGLDWLAEWDPEAHAALCATLALDPDEPKRWREAARSVHLPYDEALGVHGQDDAFLEKPRWDLAGTPPDRFPLQDHHHLLTLYRHQVLKQADVVMAHFLQRSRFEPDQRRRDFEYYEPLTTHDSSLSAPVHAVVAAQLDKLDLAWAYTEEAALIDLDDRYDTLGDGLHMAAAAGSWMALACGFGGLDLAQGLPHLRPRLPPAVRRLGFRFRFHDSLVEVDITAEGTTYTLLDGPSLTIFHHDQPLHLGADGPVQTGG